MRIIVTPIDVHPTDGHQDTFSDRGEPMTGSRVAINPDGVWLDGHHFIQRDLRMIKNRVAGHPWFTATLVPSPRPYPQYWTSFSIEIEP